MFPIQPRGMFPRTPDTGPGQYPKPTYPPGPLTGCSQSCSCVDSQNNHPFLNPTDNKPTNDSIFNSKGDLRGNREAANSFDLLHGVMNRREGD